MQLADMLDIFLNRMFLEYRIFIIYFRAKSQIKFIYFLETQEY